MIYGTDSKEMPQLRKVLQGMFCRRKLQIGLSKRWFERRAAVSLGNGMPNLGLLCQIWSHIASDATE